MIPYPDVFAEFVEVARRGIKRFVAVGDVGGREAITFGDTPPMRIEAAPVFDFGFLRDLSTGKALDLDLYNALSEQGEDMLKEGTFCLPFSDCWYVVWFSDGNDVRYATVNLYHAFEQDGGIQVVVYFRCFGAPGDLGRWSQSPVQAFWHPDIGWGALTETRFSSDHWYAERKADTSVAFNNVLVGTLLLSQHPEATQTETKTDFMERVNRGRARAKLGSLPPVRVVDVTRARERSDGTGTGRIVRPHDRRGHYRLLRTGEIVPVKASKIHGGSEAPPTYRVRW